MNKKTERPVLVTGATGYVGGRLVPYLLESGFRVRAMGRSIAKLKGRSWATHPGVELIQGDVLDRESLKKAACGCDDVFYLVHSMDPRSKSFSDSDRQGGENMRDAASECGCARIIYLSGLGDPEKEQLSKHLRSRQEVAEILTSGSVPVTVLRAAMILGTGSASFEMMRYLVERLPVMITPQWVAVRVQPISIRDVLKYLKGCLEQKETVGQTYDIGGPDIMTYRELFDIYTEEARLKRRWIIPVPFFTPSLSSYWIHLITPVPAAIARPLAEGLRNEVICTENRIRSIIDHEPDSCRDTIRLSLERIQTGHPETCWYDAGCIVPPEWHYCGDADYAGGTILGCAFRVEVAADPEQVWDPVVRIGGSSGWYFANFLWRFRGFIDRMVGGIGLRRGRRHPEELAVGDALDFWRVLEVEPHQRLVLLAEMTFPGEALLEFRMIGTDGGKTDFQMISRYLPRGLSGILYWIVLYPFHVWIFRGMLKAIAKRIGKPVLTGPVKFTPEPFQECPPPSP